MMRHLQAWHDGPGGWVRQAGRQSVSGGGRCDGDKSVQGLGGRRLSGGEGLAGVLLYTDIHTYTHARTHTHTHTYTHTTTANRTSRYTSRLRISSCRRFPDPHRHWTWFSFALISLILLSPDCRTKCLITGLDKTPPFPQTLYRAHRRCSRPSVNLFIYP